MESSVSTSTPANTSRSKSDFAWKSVTSTRIADFIEQYNTKLGMLPQEMPPQDQPLRGERCAETLDFLLSRGVLGRPGLVQEDDDGEGEEEDGEESGWLWAVDDLPAPPPLERQRAIAGRLDRVRRIQPRMKVHQMLLAFMRRATDPSMAFVADRLLTHSGTADGSGCEAGNRRSVPSYARILCEEWDSRQAASMRETVHLPTCRAMLSCLLSAGALFPELLESCPKDSSDRMKTEFIATRARHSARVLDCIETVRLGLVAATPFPPPLVRIVLGYSMGIYANFQALQRVAAASRQSVTT